ncbi:hypothetical protein ABIE51_002868 [Lysobacter sp. OAE881]
MRDEFGVIARGADDVQQAAHSRQQLAERRGGDLVEFLRVGCALQHPGVLAQRGHAVGQPRELLHGRVEFGVGLRCRGLGLLAHAVLAREQPLRVADQQQAQRNADARGEQRQPRRALRAPGSRGQQCILGGPQLVEPGGDVAVAVADRRQQRRIDRRVDTAAPGLHRLFAQAQARVEGTPQLQCASELLGVVADLFGEQVRLALQGAADAPEAVAVLGTPGEQVAARFGHGLVLERLDPVQVLEHGVGVRDRAVVGRELDRVGDHVQAERHQDHRGGEEHAQRRESAAGCGHGIASSGAVSSRVWLPCRG